jgi:hypothetical protein
MDAQDRREPPKNGNGRVLLAALDPADVPRVDLCPMRERFLRQPFGFPQALHVSADDCLPAHRRMSGTPAQSVEEL